MATAAAALEVGPPSPSPSSSLLHLSSQLWGAASSHTHTHTCPHLVLPLSGHWAQRSILLADAAQLTSQGLLLRSPSTRLSSNTVSCTRCENRTLPRCCMPHTVAAASFLCPSPPLPTFCLHVLLPPNPTSPSRPRSEAPCRPLELTQWPFPASPVCSAPRPLLRSLDPASWPQAAPWPSTASLWPPFFLNPHPLLGFYFLLKILFFLM